MQKINKKGLVLEPMLVLGVIVVFSIIAFYVLVNKGIEADVGKYPGSLIEFDREVKLKLDLIEESSTYHMYNSIIELNKNSGYNKKLKKEKVCIFWNDYKIFEDCILTKEKIRYNLKNYLQDSFNQYARDNNLNLYSIDLVQEKNKLIFTFHSPNIKFTKGDIEFVIDHKFTKEVTYDLSQISELYAVYHNKILEKCPEPEKLIAGLECRESDKSDMLEFFYRKEKFYLNNNPNSFEYPIQPVLEFKIPKVQS